MDNQKQQVVERIKQANNILVTVSASPSVDQLAACVGLTIMLNEQGKHATAVFSGAVPSTIEFLQPEKTIEKNTDSLRDFIIALDKSKADKLRYKVEDKVVKIFITPYRTSIGEKDLEFSQGDFNVDVVVALGVHEQRDLDQAITSHGRILHDAVVASINTTVGNNLGTINWQDTKASSLCEMVTALAENFDKKVLDNQVATALLTGIVAETDRFSNNKTSPETMKASAMLMAAGANQQLVATKLATPPTPPPVKPEMGGGSKESPAPPKSNDGTLRIEHQAEADKPKAPQEENPENEEAGPQIHIDEQGGLHQLNEERPFLSGPDPNASLMLPGSSPEDDEKPSGAPPESSKFVFTPPTLGGTLTANSRPESLEPSTDPLSVPKTEPPLLSRDQTPESPTGPKVIEPPKNTATDSNAEGSDKKSDNPNDDKPAPAAMPEALTSPPQITPLVEPAIPLAPAEPLKGKESSTETPNEQGHQTLSEIERAVESPHVDAAAPATDVNSARNAVMDAINAVPDTSAKLPPIDALNAQPLGGNLHDASASGSTPSAEPLAPLPGAVGLSGNPNFNEPAPDAASPSAQPLDMPLPPTLTPPAANPKPPTSSDNDPSAPPPVPPPMMPLPPTGQ